MKTKHFSPVLVLVLVLETAARAADDQSIASPGSPHARTRTFTSLATVHETYSEDFAKKPGFGMSRILFLPPQDFLTLNGETYRFDSPDLLGLEDEPVAYQRRGFETFTVAVMSKKELRTHLQRRPLTAGESNAVVQLRAGKDLVAMAKSVELVSQGATNRVSGLLAVGALRAKAQCAECHGVKEGTLLGAFSYTLVPTSPAPFAVLTLPGASTTRQPLNARLPHPTNILDHLITDAPATRQPNGTLAN